MRVPTKSLEGRRIRLDRYVGAAAAHVGDEGRVTLDEGHTVHVEMDNGEHLTLVERHGDRYTLVAP